jgi:transaldolase / glucose-6-phosphate isomerase
MEAVGRITEEDAVRRLWERDPRLFSVPEPEHAKVLDRLGWVGLAGPAAVEARALGRFAQAAVDEGVTDVVLLGMGGSSLAALVMSEILGSAPGYPRLTVMDTVSPVRVARAMRELDPAHTLFLVSSKSGGTIEPMSLYAIFRAWADEALGAEAGGRRFVAITDPHSSLETLSLDGGFRQLVHSPDDVGGRYSALTVFGMLPAALIGADLQRMTELANGMECALDTAPADNPAVRLAAFIEDSREAGRDKLTLVTSPGLASFGLWVEQLVAESLGKHGIGVVPVVERGLPPHASLGDDRAVVVMRYGNDVETGLWAAEHLGAFEIRIPDASVVVAEFVRWEFAVALTGHLMGVNPFDEPNVAEAKAATSAILDRAGAGAVDSGAPGADLPVPSAARDAAERIAEWLRPGDYLAMLAYLPGDPEQLAPLGRALDSMRDARGVACCLELGPRYLHSTGQLHKGGANTGVFLVVTAADTEDVAVPGKPFTLRELHRAQAIGDVATLQAHERRVAWVELPSSEVGEIEGLARALEDAANGSAAL